MEKLLSSKEAAEMLGIKVATLRTWRMKSKSPRYVRIGGIRSRCMYRKEDVKTWIEDRLRTSTSEETVMLEENERGLR